jgi:hypothetical protein
MTGPLGNSRLLSPDEVKQLQNLQGLFDPATCFKRIDDFSKWLFATIAVVGTLGAGLSNSAFSTLSPAGKVMFAISVTLVGASLFEAVRAMEPQWVHANLASRESMLAAVDANLLARRQPVERASHLFASALIIAALAPLASLIWPPTPTAQVSLAYDIKTDGKITGQATASKLRPFAPIELILEGGRAPNGSVLPKVRKVADEKGQASLSIELTQPSKWGTDLKLLVHWASSDDLNASLSEQRELSLKVD